MKQNMLRAILHLKIAESSVFIFSKLFVWHSSGENVRTKQR